MFICVEGPTSYGPVIDAAVDIVERSGGRYHVLVIIADGQVLFDLHLFFNMIQIISKTYGRENKT